tara:strand:+ start:761 stop:1336 length:576 start_codon:yes stop_codon:yes gene_type:complete
MQNKLPKNFLFVDKFNLNDLTFLNKNIDIIYRNYKQKASKNTLLSLKNFCKKDRRKLYLSNNIKLAIQLNLDGAYIPSFNKNLNFSNLNIQRKFEIIGSAHNKKEIMIKKLQNCKLIFLAPLFKTAKNKKYLNVIKYNLVTLNENIKFIALGGICKSNIKKVYLTKSIGFAGISWIKKTAQETFLGRFYKI